MVLGLNIHVCFKTEFETTCIATIVPIESDINNAFLSAEVVLVPS